jgi:hypothetical protein
MSGRRSRAGFAPGGTQPLAVAEPQDRGDDEQDRLVERAGDRCETERGEPAEPAGQLAVAGEQANGGHDAACEGHAVR